MNKTQARFTTTSKGQVAFLLLKDILPDRLETLEGFPLFLYFSLNDYNALMQSYWKGEAVPACEIGECMVIIDRIIKDKRILRLLVQEELAKIKDYEEWYTREVSMEDLSTLREDEPEIMDILERNDPVFTPKNND